MSETTLKIADFATAGNYPAGSDAWSGQPRVVLLSDSDKANGFTPNTPVAPEVANGLHQDHYQGRNLLLLRALDEWSKSSLNYAAGGGLRFSPFLLPVTVAGLQQKAIVAVGNDTLNSSRLSVFRDYGSGFFEDVPVSPIALNRPVQRNPGRRRRVLHEQRRPRSLALEHGEQFGGVRLARHSPVAGLLLEQRKALSA